MRRKDREMDQEFGLAVIDKASFGTLGLVGEDCAYTIPLSIAREGEHLFFHSAKAGKKVDLLQQAEKVSVVFVGEHQVPQVMTKEEADKAISSPETFGELTRKIFTTEYESAMVVGSIVKLEDKEDKIHGLEVICQKFTPQWMTYFLQAIESGLERTDVYRITIEEITSKRKKFDAFGEEMKWMRK